MNTSLTENELIVSLPLVPVKRTVLFPDTLVPFTIGRPRSIAAVEAAMNSEDKALVLATQRDSEKEEPQFDDLYLIGTKAVIKQMGNYGEIFDRNLGEKSPYKLKRGLTALWSNGGVLYAPVFD